ncbi:DUF1656 domain-containing protein [Solimonas soli]|uniref:DUF1656 domain-containing protein n=1 Tax=Solimonas soli TaxID=413479 RepID=UPI0004889FBB|nr:DUF1656 domain-containing protein [Solimonas soli]
MPGQFDVYGVFFPALLVLMVAAYAIKAGLRMLLARFGFYRWVWHPALFNTALYVVVLWLLLLLVRQAMS